MPTKKANATWRGTLKEGDGTMSTESGAYEGEFSFAKRFGDEPGTNPEELIGAAHAGCFSMAFANELDEAGYPADEVSTEASVHLADGSITRIDLVTEATVPDIDDDQFQEIANDAKENCPVSRALTGGSIQEITLDATLQ
ncbi:peroxiredoxin [Halobacteriales archaeon QS_1_68_20]|nr:MAG: peroxiredoxin [Halobacteriales archaeon QS_1_68_20]